MKFLSSLTKSKLKGKIVLVRIDLNVVSERLGDMYRLDAIVPTLKLLISAGAKVVLLSHKGRPHSVKQDQLSSGDYKMPKGNRELSLAPFTKVISKKIGVAIKFFPHFDFEKIRWEITTRKEKIYLLENIRFCAEEEENDKKFARTLASLGDFYVNDAFAVSHRKHASVYAIATYLPAYAGLCLEQEIKSLKLIMATIKQPFVVLLGGVKAKDKLGILKNFWKKADVFLLGGGPANTFFVAQGEHVGDSVYDKDSIPFIEKYIESEKIFLPLDDEIGKKKILDIGPQTRDEYTRLVSHARMIFWNGTMGYYYDKKFATGTKKIWEAILQNKTARVVVGGGETIDSLCLVHKKPQELMRSRKNLFLSTGGGAMLEFLSGKKLPGIEVLK